LKLTLMRWPAARLSGTSWRSQLSHSMSVPALGVSLTCTLNWRGADFLRGGALLTHDQHQLFSDCCRSFPVYLARNPDNTARFSRGDLGGADRGRGGQARQGRGLRPICRPDAAPLKFGVTGAI